MNPLVLTPARLSEAPAWIAESLAFLAEARQCLTKGDLPGKPTKLLGEIDALERDLQFLITIKRNGLEPLRARLRNNLLEQRQGRFAGNIYDEWLEWVRKLCAADMPALAEQLAAAPSFDEEVAAGLTNAPIPLIGYVGRHYLAHGNRAEGIRVLTEAAASSPMVRLDNAGGVAPGPLMLLAFPEPGDVDAAIAVSRGLKDPFVQSAALLAVARRSVEGGDRNKAQEVLRQAEKVVESAAAALPAETRSMALVTPYLRLGRAYRDFDAKKTPSTPTAPWKRHACSAIGKSRTVRADCGRTDGRRRTGVVGDDGRFAATRLRLLQQRRPGAREGRLSLAAGRGGKRPPGQASLRGGPRCGDECGGGGRRCRRGRDPAATFKTIPWRTFARA